MSCVFSFLIQCLFPGVSVVVTLHKLTALKLLRWYPVCYVALFMLLHCTGNMHSYIITLLALHMYSIFNLELSNEFKLQLCLFSCRTNFVCTKSSLFCCGQFSSQPWTFEFQVPGDVACPATDSIASTAILAVHGISLSCAASVWVWLNPTSWVEKQLAVNLQMQ